MLKGENKAQVKTALSQHLTTLVKLIHHPSGGLFQCNLCDKTESKSPKMEKHIREVHVSHYKKMMTKFPQFKSQSQLEGYIINIFTSFFQFGQPVLDDKAEDEDASEEEEEVSDSEDCIKQTPKLGGKLRNIIEMRKAGISKYWQGGSKEKMAKVLHKKSGFEKTKKKVCYVCGECFRKLKPLKNHVKQNHKEVWEEVETGTLNLDYWKRVPQLLGGFEEESD